jgi:uncharacterized protein (TIGR03437 family)
MHSQSGATSVSESGRKTRRSFWPGARLGARLGAIVLSLAILAHAQAPAVNAGGIVNAASGSTQGIAPGSIVSIFGTNLASANAASSAVPLPVTLSDVVSVTFNNIAAPLFYVSPLQINAQVPWNVLPAGTASGTASVVVTRSSGASPAQSVQVVAALPGIFTVSQNGIGQAIATNNTDGDIAAAANPISIGDYLIVWCTGMGAVSPAIASGAAAASGTFSNTLLTPVVTIGGVTATFVYSVLSPQYVGVNQIGVQVAPNTPTGNSIPLQIQVNGVTTSAQVTIAVQAATSAFNTLTPSIAIFDPTTLSGLPTITASDGSTLPAVGYQGGDLVSGKVLYYPWAVLTATGTNIQETISAAVAYGVMMSYDASTSGFTDASNWTFFDMTTVDPAAGGFNAAVVVGTNVYMVPIGNHNGGLPAFVLYDATKAVNDSTAYQFVDAPPRGGALGSTYGWCEGVFDGTYMYYVPNMDPDAGTSTSASPTFSGNVIRYNTTTPFSLSGGGWSSFDMTTVNPQAAAFQSGVYDGHRYIYFIPFREKIMVRYDTQYGTPGTPNPAAFTNPAAYTFLDTTQLGTTGLPQVVGQGSATKLAGFTGGAVVWDAAQQNEYLYLVPWAVYTSTTPTVQSTVGRVRIGTQSGTAWNAVDITSTAASTSSLIGATPNWEVFDLNTLTTNPQWTKNGWPYPAIYSSGALVGQTMIGGYQGTWINTSSASPRVGFGADVAQYWVEHDVSHALADPTGWYVAKVPPQHRNGTFGGAYDAVHQIFYPASPSVPLIQASGL